jgi:hypothetical protein
MIYLFFLLLKNLVKIEKKLPRDNIFTFVSFFFIVTIPLCNFLLFNFPAFLVNPQLDNQALHVSLQLLINVYVLFI